MDHGAWTIYRGKVQLAEYKKDQTFTDDAGNSKLTPAHCACTLMMNGESIAETVKVRLNAEELPNLDPGTEVEVMVPAQIKQEGGWHTTKAYPAQMKLFGRVLKVDGQAVQRKAAA